MKKTGILFTIWLFSFMLTAQPLRYLQATYPTSWDEEYPEWVGVFDGIDDYLSPDLLANPYVTIEMVVLNTSTPGQYNKYFGNAENPYYALGYNASVGGVYGLANGTSFPLGSILLNEWVTIRFNPNTGKVTYGNYLHQGITTVNSGDSIFFGGQWDEPIQNFMQYEWKNIKIWQYGKMTHYLIPQEDGSAKNLKERLGENSLDNPGFDDSTYWSVSGESTVNTGVGRIYSPDGSYSQISNGATFEIGKKYIVEGYITNIAEGSGHVVIPNGTVNPALPQVEGFFSIIIDSAQTEGFNIKRGATTMTDVSVDNLTVREVLDSIFYNKGRTTNAEPLAVKYLGAVPTVAKYMSTYDGTTDKTQFNSFDDFDWTSGGDSIVNISFKFIPDVINQNTTLLSDRLTNRNFHIYLSDNERFNIMTTNADGTFFATSSSGEPYVAGEVHSVNIEIDTHAAVKSVTVTGSFNVSYTYTGDLTDAATNSVLYIAQRNTGYFDGHMWDINMDDQFYFPLPGLGYGFQNNGDGTYTTVSLATTGAPILTEDANGTNWFNDYGYVYKSIGDYYVINKPDKTEAYALENGDRLYNIFEQTAKIYYVNKSAGNDANDGLSPATAWASINKVNAEQDNFYDGDSILFAAGDVYTTQLTPTKSGSVLGRINYGKYGSGPNPKFSAFKLLRSSDFTHLGGNIYETTSAVTTQERVKVLVHRDKMYSKGRTPNLNEGLHNSGYYYRAGGSGSSSGWISSDSILSGTDYTGRQAVLRKRHWIMDWITATGGSGNSFNFVDGLGHYSISSGTGGFFFINNIADLDRENEWYHNETTDKIGIYKENAFDSIYISDKDYLISISNVNNLSFTNLDFEGANQAAFFMVSCANIYIEYDNFKYCYDGILGVNGGNSTQFVLDNNYFQDILNNCIWLDNEFEKGSIQNNEMHRIAALEGMGGEPDGTYNGVRVMGDSLIIQYNIMDSVGYQAITSNGIGNIIKYNYINTFCFIKDDGSGIYRARQNPCEIAYNHIYNGVGNWRGYEPYDPASPWNKADYANGIYSDDEGQNMYIHHNVIYNMANHGIFLHRNHGNMTLTHNKIYDARGWNGVLNVQSEPYGTAEDIAMRDLNIKHNEVFSLTQNQLVFRIETSFDDLDLIGDIDSNLYASPLDSDYVAGYRTASMSSAGINTTRYKLQAYKDSLLALGVTNIDQNSVDPKKTVYLAETFEFYGNPSDEERFIEFPDTMMTFKYDTIYPGTYIMEPWGAELFINAGDILPYRKYYFNWGLGDDGNDGLSPENPKKSLKGLLAIQPELLPGDSIFFNRGDVWRVSTDTLLKIRKSGGDGKPIIYTAYGTGDKPVISGFEPQTMSAIGVNLYESSAGASKLDKPNIVRIDGEIRQKGRFPNTGWTSVTETYVDEQIVVPGLSGLDLNGADLVSRKTREVIDVAQITYQNTSEFITEATGREYLVGSGVFVTNSPDLLDTDYEWYYDNSTDKIRVYNSTSNFTVEVSGADYLVDFQQHKNVTFENMVFEGANLDAMWLKSAKHATIKNCEFRDCYNGINAIRYTSAGLPTTGYGLIVQNNVFVHMANNGIRVESEYGDALIADNAFDRIGMLPGLGGNGFSAQYSGIMSDVVGVTIRDNTFTNMGYSVIETSRNDATVENNFIDGYCLVKDNSAGIGISDSNVIVQNNIVTNGLGNPSGTTFSTGSAYGVWAKSDHQYVTMHSNAIYNTANSSIILSDGKGYTTVTDNVAVKAGNETFGVLNIQTDDGSNGFRNNTITGNVFGSLMSGQPVVRIYTTTNDIASFGTINNNIWSNAIDTVATISYQTSAGGAVNEVSLTTWQANYAHDAGTTDPQHAIASELDYVFGYNETGSNKSVSLPWSVYSVIYDTVLPSGSVLLSPWESFYGLRND